MSGSSTLSLRVEDQIIDALDMAAEETLASRSKIARTALLLGIEELTDADGEVTVPEHVAHDARIKRLIASNKRTRRAGKYRSEFSKQLKKSFKNNEHPAEFKKSVSGYIEEAEEMGELPPEVAAETGCETFEAWVHDKIDYYTAAYQASTFDGDPIENPLGDFEGISGARDWMATAEKIATMSGGSKMGHTPRREKAAAEAITRGNVPKNIKEKANSSDRDTAKVVAEAAIELHQSSSHAIEPDTDSDTDTSELNR